MALDTGSGRQLNMGERVMAAVGRPPAASVRGRGTGTMGDRVVRAARSARQQRILDMLSPVPQLGAGGGQPPAQSPFGLRAIGPGTPTGGGLPAIGSGAPRAAIGPGAAAIGPGTAPAAQTVAPVVTGPAIPMGGGASPAAAAAAQAGTRFSGANLGGGATAVPGQAALNLGAANAARGAGTAGAATVPPAAAAAAQAAAGTAATGATPAAATGLRGMFAPGGRFAAGTLGRAGLYGGAGLLGSSLARGAIGNQDGVVDDVAVNAIGGAGIGAGIGSLIPGVGTAIGAGVGAGAGALWGALRGGDSTETASTRELDKQTTRLNQMFDNYGVSADLRDQLNMQLALTAEGRPPAEVRVLADEIRASAVGLISQDKEMQKQDAARAGALAAVQGWMGPMMQTQIDAANVYAQDLSLAMTEAAKNLPTEALREAALAQAARVPLDTATQNAYALQQAAFGAYQYDMASQQAAMQAILGLSGQVGGAVPGMQNGGGVDPAALFDPSASLMPTG